jgi:hypothetical protein
VEEARAQVDVQPPQGERLAVPEARQRPQRIGEVHRLAQPQEDPAKVVEALYERRGARAQHLGIDI